MTGHCTDARSRRGTPGTAMSHSGPQSSPDGRLRAPSSGSGATCESTTTPPCTTRCRRAAQVCCVFVFDREILDALPERADRRVEFILALRDRARRRAARAAAAGCIVLHDRCAARRSRGWRAQLRRRGGVREPRLRAGRAWRATHAVARRARAGGPALLTSRTRWCSSADEVLTGSRRPFSVFTPYRNAWQRRLEALGADGRPGPRWRASPVRELAGVLRRRRWRQLPTLASLGFARTNLHRCRSRPARAARHCCSTTSSRASAATTKPRLTPR